MLDQSGIIHMSFLKISLAWQDCSSSHEEGADSHLDVAVLVVINVLEDGFEGWHLSGRLQTLETLSRESKESDRLAAGTEGQWPEEKSSSTLLSALVATLITGLSRKWLGTSQRLRLIFISFPGSKGKASEKLESPVADNLKKTLVGAFQSQGFTVHYYFVETRSHYSCPGTFCADQASLLQKSTCLLSARTKGVCHHAKLAFTF